MRFLRELFRSLFARRVHSLQEFIGYVAQKEGAAVTILPFMDGDIVETDNTTDPTALMRFQLLFWADLPGFRRTVLLQDVSYHIGSMFGDDEDLQRVSLHLQLLLTARQRKMWIQSHLNTAPVTVIGPDGELLHDAHFQSYEEKLRALEEKGWGAIASK